MSWTEADVRVADATLHTYRMGAGVPVIVAHGVTDNGRSWTRVGRELAGEFEVIAYDARCHGRSESVGYPDGRRSGDDAADLVVALDLDRPFVMGHSMGAMTAFLAVYEHPERFRGAVLEDPGFDVRMTEVATTSDKRAEMHAAFIERARAARESPLADVIAETRGESPELDEEDLLAAADSLRELRPAGDWIGAAYSAAHWQEFVTQLRVPTLLVCGEPARGAIVTQATAEWITANAPGVESVVFDSGHYVRRDAFDGFVDVVHAFLLRHT